jgi:AraC family transcriptional regulator of adaptative response/methylated-DNA-[protein]-cysteine methyltransferase
MAFLNQKHEQLPVVLVGDSSNTAWEAVLRRDRSYDRKFVYVAVTTGIYCRPSCPSRRPYRHNALIFSNAAEAEEAGYVACLRCHPGSLTPAEKSIKVALEHIEEHFDRRIILEELSRISGLSPNHLQQTFKQIVGVTPKAFCNARRFIRFKQLLRAGESVSRACYEVGFGSSRGLYEKVWRWLGMTPRTYQRGGEGTVIRYALTQSFLGRLLVAGTERGVCSIRVGHDDGLLVRDLQEEFGNASLLRDEKFLNLRAFSARSSLGEDPFLSMLPIVAQHRIFETKLSALIALHTPII